MEPILLKLENYEQYLPLDIAALSYSFGGACGDGGGVEILTADGKLYYFNRLSGDLDDAEIIKIIPFLYDCHFLLVGSSDDMPSGWKNIYLGLGNNLVVRSDIVESLQKAWMEYNQREGTGATLLYCVWKDLVLQILSIAH